MQSDPYPTDLTDAEWQIVAPLFTKSSQRVRNVAESLPMSCGVSLMAASVFFMAALRGA